jgi:hypothetical protein
VPRGEVTGKKPRTTPVRAKRQDGPPKKVDPGAIEPTRSSEPSLNGAAPTPKARGPPPVYAAAFTVSEFCEAHRISETTYYELKKNGLGPDEMVAGRRRIISFEAAARWRKARETAAAEAAE